MGGNPSGQPRGDHQEYVFTVGFFAFLSRAERRQKILVSSGGGVRGAAAGTAGSGLVQTSAALAFPTPATCQGYCTRISNDIGLSATSTRKHSARAAHYVGMGRGLHVRTGSVVAMGAVALGMVAWGRYLGTPPASFGALGEHRTTRAAWVVARVGRAFLLQARLGASALDPRRPSPFQIGLWAGPKANGAGRHHAQMRYTGARGQSRVSAEARMAQSYARSGVASHRRYCSGRQMVSDHWTIPAAEAVVKLFPWLPGFARRRAATSQPTGINLAPSPTIRPWLEAFSVHTHTLYHTSKKPVTVQTFV